MRAPVCHLQTWGALVAAALRAAVAFRTKASRLSARRTWVSLCLPWVTCLASLAFIVCRWGLSKDAFALAASRSKCGRTGARKSRTCGQTRAVRRGARAAGPDGDAAARAVHRAGEVGLERRHEDRERFGVGREDLGVPYHRGDFVEGSIGLEGPRDSPLFWRGLFFSGVRL